MKTINNIDLDSLVWKKVIHPEIKNLEVSEYGHLRRTEGRCKGTIRKGTLDNNGYYSVRLRTYDSTKKFLVHRLVCLAFNPEGYFEGAKVDHIDESKTNNHYSNLRWLSQKENVIKNRKFQNLIGLPKRKLSEREVRRVRKLYDNGTSISLIWRSLNNKVTYPTIINIVKRISYKNVI